MPSSGTSSSTSSSATPPTSTSAKKTARRSSGPAATAGSWEASIRVLEVLPKTDPSYPFYLERLNQLSASIAQLQRPDGLWSPGLLDTPAYPLPEASGSAFFVYALAWGINHHALEQKVYGPIVAHAWKGLFSNIYADGRLGSIQPVGAAHGAFTASSSYAFGGSSCFAVQSRCMRRFTPNLFGARMVLPE